MHAKKQVIEYIEQHGSIDVAKYMEICISHYYASRDPFGSDGDFTTAPEISQIFGELLGAWLLDKWKQIGKPQAILCEIGPGRGTLMHDILRITAKSGLQQNIQIAMIETSPTLREIQAVKLASYNNINWYDSFAEIPKLPLLLVANEFFDALPIRQYVGDVERKIMLDANANLEFSPQGEVTFEDSPISLHIMGEICEHIKQYGGAGLIIDYGYVNAKHGDSLQALSKHKF
ncbi:MAG: SAM-dependent methyltransferase, partial [Pseudomonadota bacterium]